MLRTHTCGEINEGLIDKEVTLAGWVHSRRDHGELIFIDLRDAYGVVQVVFDPEHNRGLHTDAHQLKSEYVISIKGRVRQRPKGTENTKIPTGMVEVLVNSFEILNQARTPPFEIDDSTSISEEVRLKYRYVDLRRPIIQKNLRLRHRVSNIMRNFLSEKGFVEIETPILTKSTPEGARDYLVPSRTNVGKFFALPQSPQLFKQILMVSGFDRYFQVARCFRDEDLRADRQPEFTQLDLEMSFVEEDDIFSISEDLMSMIFKETLNLDLKRPFPRLKYEEVLTQYGTDKPDLRLELDEIKDVTSIFEKSEFKIFQEAIKKEGGVFGFVAKGCRDFSRQKMDEWTKFAGEYGAKGLTYFKVEKDKVSSPIQKFFNHDEIDKLKNAMKAEDGDLLLLVSDIKDVALQALGALRSVIGKERGLVKKEGFNFLWVVEFPLFKYNKEEKRWESEHHPFTSLRSEDIPLLEKGELKNIRSRSYDLVVNGIEIASGSIRIHSRELQEKIFKVLGLNRDEARKRFGFLMDAFEYGAPPHGGIAFGFDRFITLFTKSDTIRDVIAFPKTQKAICPMTDAPSSVDEKQLKELHIRREKINGR